MISCEVRIYPLAVIDQLSERNEHARIGPWNGQEYSLGIRLGHD